MTDKQAILAVLTPLAVLKAMTPEAERSVADGMIVAGMVSIRRFPFRIGRESRGRMIDGKFHRQERPKLGNREPNNDLYLVDAGMPLQISREHLRIEKTAAGYVVVDRGSACGTTVAGGTRVGGNDTDGSAPLKDGDTIGIGTQTTPFVFSFITLA
ncbi:MAG TPA: FHA domain-containing protein [Burkholderiales bacterium]|nr:FHA domain-containing protein [Burkholderiales bacterium]